MKPPKRFALSTLLLAIFAVAAVFGYAQWRRQKLVTEVKSLRAAGVEWLTVDEKLFYPKVSQQALISAVTVSEKSHADASDIPRILLDLQQRLRVLGVNDITYELVVMQNFRVVGTRKYRLADLENLEMFNFEPYEKSLNRVLSTAPKAGR